MLLLLDGHTTNVAQSTKEGIHELTTVQLGWQEGDSMMPDTLSYHRGSNFGLTRALHTFLALLEEVMLLCMATKLLCEWITDACLDVSAGVT